MRKFSNTKKFYTDAMVCILFSGYQVIPAGKTKPETEEGAICLFPFTYDGRTHHCCINDDYERYKIIIQTTI